MSESDQAEAGPEQITSVGVLDQIADMGSWADIMQNEEPESFDDSKESLDQNESIDSVIEDNQTEEKTQVELIRSTDGREVLIRPPYYIRVRNVSTQATTEDLFFHFGGKEAIEEIEIDHSKNIWSLLMTSPKHVEDALTLHNSYMFARQLQVIAICCSSSIDKISEDDSEYIPRTGNNGSFRGYSSSRGYHGQPVPQQPFIPQSQYSQHQHVYPPYSGNIQPLMMIPTHSPNTFGVIPQDGSYSNFQNRNHYSQKFDKQRGMPGGNRAYNNRGKGDHNHRAFVMERNEMPREISKRTSSERLSTISLASGDTQKSTDSIMTIRKPTNKDLFGDAKPVDTTAKLLEIENRKREEEKKIQQQQKINEEMIMNQQRPTQSRDSRYGSHEERTASTSIMLIKEGKNSSKSTPPPPDEYGSMAILRRPSISKEDPFDASPPNDPIQHTSVKNTPSPPAVSSENPKVRTFSKKTRGNFPMNQHRSNTGPSNPGSYRGRGNRGNQMISSRGGPRGNVHLSFSDRTSTDQIREKTEISMRTASERKNSFTARGESHSLNVSFEGNEKAHIERKSSTPVVTSNTHPEEPTRGRGFPYRGSQRGFKASKRTLRANLDLPSKGKTELVDKHIHEGSTQVEKSEILPTPPKHEEVSSNEERLENLALDHTPSTEESSEKAKEKRRKKPNKERQLLNAMPKIDDQKVTRPVNLKNKFEAISHLTE